jgi:hypothetical protein
MILFFFIFDNGDPSPPSLKLGDEGIIHLGATG